MGDIGQSSDAASYFQNAIAAQAVSAISQHGVGHLPNANEDMYNLGALNGYLKLEQVAPSIQSAQKADQAAADTVQWEQMARFSPHLTGLPGLLKPLEYRVV